MTTNLGLDVELPLAFGDAVARVKDALRQEEFGILTETDLQAAFREKLGREFRPYVILGACNPPLAYSAINADPAVGLLLPCVRTVSHDARNHGQTPSFTGARRPVSMLREVVD
jgi:uncharacterized protein (DUF302 family)